MQRPLRLRHRQDFARLRAEGRAVRHRWLILSFGPNTLSHNRYGFVASRQVGNAVMRNRVRRQLREGMRQFHPQLLPGYDIAVIARRGLAGQPSDAIHAALKSTLDRAGLWADAAGLYPGESEP